ncbi:MFS transporter [Candidatus Nomurabacteria bacterium RIFOXYB1_FULL_39_16]|uniref:Major facilitator superfamily n=2 Tax=Candidatus Nomuraibacteriota TaxID=1752729 RepID=A0A0G0TZM6_9BACT|nr:MAG: Major facilitator superfamily [Candidatus Nomurabacteria bacterium GW2011_GWF2_40_12]OGJ09451.1 MAG: MFS transporter [Candidatus Nomurabacteria bacterium RIFOXYB1_FULL_39_16]OGJ14812.1 MAG: MFS transporter [Candidatus Nomurabacteria bacterium RIFOXYD1_FULL_39_12]
MEKRPFNVHPDVFKLGIVSFLTDISSEAVFSVFSVFFTVIVGAPATLLGLVEGLSDLSASSLDYFSGWLSDRSGKRKKYTILGYGFSTLAKVMLLMGSSVVALASFRIIERMGKSFRGPPRDAWLSEVAEGPTRGYAFAVHKAMDKAGAILGPLIVYVMFLFWGQGASTFRIIFIMAVITAAVSVAVLALMKDRPGIPHERENIFEAWKTLSPDFKKFLIPSGIFSIAYFSFGFLLLRAYDIGFVIKDVVLLYALFNISFVAISVPIGKLGDLIGRKYIIILGYLTYLVMSLGFIFATEKWQIIVLFILYGIFYSIDAAQGRAFIVDLEKERRATAMGAYNLVVGMIYLLASLIAGGLWVFNPMYTFIFAAFMTLVAMGVFTILFRTHRVDFV